MSYVYSDETLEGVFPFVTGKTVKILSYPADIRYDGVYLWAEKNDTIMRTLHQQYKVNVLFENKIGEECIRLARIIPGTSRKGL